jgi:LacI family repressor for deo operon, udp, cdd, tsx, nupC, and nupG
MPATIQDVANQAGVSTATVSRALRGLPNVSPDTRNQVIHVAERLNYQITPHVSRMARGRRVVGIVVPLADQWFYSKLVSIAELELMRQDCDVARYSVESVAGQESLLQHLTARKLVDGLILCSLSLSDQTTEIVGKAGIAVATIETTRPELPSVYIDNGAAAELGARHLINLGHRNIAIITGMESAPLQFAIPNARREGFLSALKQADIEFRPELEQPGNYIYQGGAEAMKHLYSVHQPPTAVFALSDEMAIGALKSVRDMNLRVPEDISIMGFDDNDVSEYVGLTTVHQPVVRFAETASAQIIAQFAGTSSSDIAPVHFLPELIVRSTTGPISSR